MKTTAQLSVRRSEVGEAASKSLLSLFPTGVRDERATIFSEALDVTDLAHGEIMDLLIQRGWIP